MQLVRRPGPPSSQETLITSHTPGAHKGRRPLLLAAAAAVIVAVAAAGFGGWYLFLRPSGRPPVDVGSLAIGSSGQVASSSSAAWAVSEPAARTPSGAGSSSGTRSAGLDGTWNVDPAIGTGDTGSFVGYRVQEQLASIGANTAVGRTSSVSGTFTVSGTKITAATFTADLTNLRSDDSRRDGMLRHTGIETSSYPTATFVLSQPVDLGSIPADGQVVSATAAGQLTLHGVTKSVEVPLQAKMSGAVIAVTGSLPVTFADYGMTPPTSFMVLSVADHGTMELQLSFRHP